MTNRKPQKPPRPDIRNVRYAPPDIALDRQCECILFDLEEMGGTILGELRDSHFSLNDDSQHPENIVIAHQVLQTGRAWLMSDLVL